jgi:hypothetical protein
VAQRVGKLDAENDNPRRALGRLPADGLHLLDTQRRELVRLRDEGRISDEVLRVLTHEFDLEDQRLEV